MSSIRSVLAVHSARHVKEGTVTMRRPLPTDAVPSIGPVIFFDHIGPRLVDAGTIGTTPPHPHAGLDTLSYVMEGCAEHRDSLGNEVTIAAGDAQWMRAGRGIVHTEGPGRAIRESGGRVHVAQLWLNLPRDHKHDEPAYEPIGRREIPEFRIADATVRLLAGRLDGQVGPLKAFADTFIAHIVFDAGGVASLPVPAALELGAYCLSGMGAIGPCPVPEGAVALLGDGTVVDITADKAASLIVFGGAALDAPIVRHGPFVMNTESQIHAALADYEAGRMGVLVEAAA